MSGNVQKGILGTVILRDAADLLRKDGWCQRVYSTLDGKRCMVQAVIDAAGDHPTRDVFRALSEVTGYDFITWNDRPGRTVDDVTTALKLAASIEATRRD